jgi:outer membrane protein, multidrug efflux system
MKRNSTFIQYMLFAFVVLGPVACKIADLPLKSENKTLPAYYGAAKDSANTAAVNWRNYFTDPNLVALIDTALQSNQELNIALREIEMGRNEIMARKGEYRPFADLAFGTGLERSGRYTWDGVSEEDLKSRPDKFPEFVGDQSLMGVFSWEVDAWDKLHNAKDAAIRRYLASIEGRNFVVTNLVAEIANAYYELIVLDNQLSIVQQNIDLQQNALELVRVQKQAARVNELAVNRFEAQLINTQNLRYDIQQMIVEAENKINFLLGRYPQPVKRQTQDLRGIELPPLAEGVPAQLLANRPDVRQAEQALEASKLDVKVAKANFYPNFTLRAGIGFRAFNPVYLLNPKSIAVNILGDMVAPLINRNAIRATYYNASAKQIQTVYSYQQTLLNAYTEIMNQLSSNQNYSQSFEVKTKQVDILNRSIDISESLFKSARADYTEVLLTQREALEAKMELTEIKKKQINATINLYKALGGGWR